MHANRFASLSLLLAAALLQGCLGTASTETLPTATVNSDVAPAGTQEPDHAAAADNDTGNAESGVAIPDGVPSDLYVAATPTAAELAAAGGKQNLVLEYPESDIEAFIEAYHHGMTEQGWTLVTSSQLPLGTIANFTKDDRKCTVSIAPPKNQRIKVAIVLPGQ